MEGINLIHGDSLQALKGYADNHFDVAIVDPPYGIGESSNDNKSRSKLAKAKDYGNKNWDDKAPDLEYFTELKRVSKNQIIFGANHFIENIPKANSSCWIVWDKVNGESDFADCELAWCSFNSAVRLKSLRWAGMLQHDMKNKEFRIHPTQKPVQLYKWLLENYTNEKDFILDTHLGSGSIAIACHYMKRNLIGYEIDKEYYDAACKRFKEQTMQQTLW